MRAFLNDVGLVAQFMNSTSNDLADAMKFTSAGNRSRQSNVSGNVIGRLPPTTRITTFR